MKLLALWFVARLKERRTYIGLAWLLTVSGLTLRPDLWDQITLVGMALAGLLEVVFKEPRFESTPANAPDPAAVAEWGRKFERMRNDPVPPVYRPSPCDDQEPPGFGDR